MNTPRRRFLIDSGLLTSGLMLAGCTRPSSGPAYLATSDRKVVRQLPGIPTMDGDGVQLTRVIGQPALRNLDPFIMLDRFHSDDPNAYIRGFPDHPHRGFETVTVMLEGRMRHRDSKGNEGLISAGGVQWMTAGRGIVHSEMPEQEKGLMSGFQLWLNLPAKEKGCPQHYQDLKADQIPEHKLSAAGTRLRVIGGKAGGLSGPVRERPTEPLLLTAFLEDDTPVSLDLGRDHCSFVFVSSGQAEVGPPEASTVVEEGTLAILSAGTRLRMRARERRSELLIASGRPLREPIVQRGPFVMNTEQEIQQAIADYRAGVLDKG